MTTGKKLLIPSFFCVVGVFLIIGGLFFPNIPALFYYLGQFIFVTGILGGIAIFHYYKHYFTILIVVMLWFTGSFIAIKGCCLEVVPFVMASTAIINIPILALICYLAETKKRTKIIRSLLFIGVLFVSLLLPHYLIFELDKSYPPEAEEITVESDELKDKDPTFIDKQSMWLNQKVETNSGAELDYGCQINKSGAVIGIDIAKFKSSEKNVPEKLFSTYEQALDYADNHNIDNVIPSVQMLDQKSKVYADSLYAALETYVQKKWKAIQGGKRHFVESILTHLIESEMGKGGCIDAAAYLAAGLELGGREDLDLPDPVVEKKNHLKKEFLSKKVFSKPVGFYTQSEELKRIFKQDRFFQQCLELPSAIDIARVLKQNPQLQTQYKKVLIFYSRMTNPASRFSVLDLLDYSDYFHDAGKMKSRMLASGKWKTLVTRGAGRVGEPPCIQLFPHSTSMENKLFAKIYNQSPSLPSHNIMNRLIKAIRNGEIDLSPTEDSGWYDYQIYALETFLVQENGQEFDKLMLTKAYKKRLLEAFKTILTKKRELHVKQVELVPTAGGGGGPRYIRIHPELSVEPTATFYLRTARGYRFIQNCLESIIGTDDYEKIHFDDGAGLKDSTEKMAMFYYGLYITVCEDIGMQPDFLENEISKQKIRETGKLVSEWLKNYRHDNCYKQDVRYIVPALSNLDRTRVRYWMTLGVKLLKIKTEYIKKPRLRIRDTASGEIIKEITPEDEDSKIYSGRYVFKNVPQEYYLPVEIFGEGTGPAEPYTREEFRKICDKNKTKEDIIRAVGNSRTVQRVKLILISGFVCMFLIGAILISRRYALIKGSRSSGGKE